MGLLCKVKRVLGFPVREARKLEKAVFGKKKRGRRHHPKRKRRH